MTEPANRCEKGGAALGAGSDGNKIAANAMNKVTANRCSV